MLLMKLDVIKKKKSRKLRTFNYVDSKLDFGSFFSSLI